MSEKKGNTVKITFDFDTCKCLEVYIELMQKWHRVISKEFRSFNGKRRITTWDREDNPIYTDYDGPVYYYMTNTICKKPEGNKIQHLNTPIQAKPRQYESFDLAPRE